MEKKDTTPAPRIITTCRGCELNRLCVTDPAATYEHRSCTVSRVYLQTKLKKQSELFAN